MPGEQTCAACAEHFATNIYPWWFYVGLTLCLAVVIAELALINWTRFVARSSRVDDDQGADYQVALPVKSPSR